MYKRIRLTPAQCAVDLSNGSERGLYVGSDYVIGRLGRPHRAVNIMYCYYPLDETWPRRAQDAYPDMDISFAWDYPYDNYFPYLGGKDGSRDGEPFESMRDIRRHGQDVILTLTCDPRVSDEHIIAIAKDLRSFGRIMLRLNHECTGGWFSFNKRASFAEIGDFFVRFSRIVREYAPNVRMIICAGAIDHPGAVMVDKEAEFTEAIKAADIWSIDKYIALNWGWPYEVAEKDNRQHKLDSPELTYELTRRTYMRYLELNGGVSKPMSMAELNADGDVTGPYDQIVMMKRFCECIKNDPERWFRSFCLYQFRDDGRLGLETTDPNNSSVGIEQPLLAAYREIISDDFFKPGMTDDGQCELPVTLRWGGSEDATGLSIPVSLESDPVFCELNYGEELADANLMLEFNGRWFYKAPGVRFTDLMPAFYGARPERAGEIPLNIFAPPATGENDPDGGRDLDINYYYELKALPELRVRYAPIMTV